MTLTATQLLAVTVLIIVAFLLGIGTGSIYDTTTTPPPKVEYVKVPDGDFNDVPMRMTSTGTTFNYLCDLHFTGPIDTAECEHTDD